MKNQKDRIKKIETDLKKLLDQKPEPPKLIAADRLRGFLALESQEKAAAEVLKRLKAAREAEEQYLIGALEAGARPAAGGPLASIDRGFRRNVAWKQVCEKELGPLRVQQLANEWPETETKKLVVSEPVGMPK